MRRLLLLVALWMVCVGAAVAQDEDTLQENAQAQLDSMQKVLKQAEAGLDKSDKDQLGKLTDEVTGAQRQAQDLVRTLDPPLKELNVRLEALGVKQAGEPKDLTKQRESLAKERDGLDAESKRAMLLVSDATPGRSARARTRATLQRAALNARRLAVVADILEPDCAAVA